MNKYIISYRDKSGDITNIWLYAHNEQDAEERAMREYWDIEEIVEIQLGKLERRNNFILVHSNDEDDEE